MMIIDEGAEDNTQGFGLFNQRIGEIEEFTEIENIRVKVG